MTITTGEIIYKAFIPTLKMALCILAGFVASRGGAIPPASTRGLNIVTMHIALPCLIFSSMVSAFTPQSVSAFGPLVMMGVLYQAVGLLLAWIVSRVVYVPRDFRWGILVMGIISNWGNLPTAVVQTVATNAPFDPKTDVDLGVAYVSIFILIMNTTFFAMGVHKGVHKLRHRRSSSSATRHLGDAVTDVSPQYQSQTVIEGRHDDTVSATALSLSRTASPRPPMPDLQGVVQSADPSATSPTTTTENEKARDTPSTQAVDHLPPPSTTRRRRCPSLGAQISAVLKYIPPPTWAVIIGWTGTRVPLAPDGNPPLHVVLDTAAFLGAMTVPLALILLGVSFARLKMPSRWRDLPLAAIVLMTLIKMVIVPIFAVLVILALRRHTGLFPPSQKIRTFVAILLSGSPAATNQLVVTQLYNPEGTAHTLASFLLLQYALMFILSTALAAIALYIVE